MPEAVCVAVRWKQGRLSRSNVRLRSEYYGFQLTSCTRNKNVWMLVQLIHDWLVVTDGDDPKTIVLQFAASLVIGIPLFGTVVMRAVDENAGARAVLALVVEIGLDKHL